jgi:hypothetical protein
MDSFLVFRAALSLAIRSFIKDFCSSVISFFSRYFFGFWDEIESSYEAISFAICLTRSGSAYDIPFFRHRKYFIELNCVEQTVLK